MEKQNRIDGLTEAEIHCQMRECIEGWGGFSIYHRGNIEHIQHDGPCHPSFPANHQYTGDRILCTKFIKRKSFKKRGKFDQLSQSANSKKGFR